jgi:hypothetical protein
VNPEGGAAKDKAAFKLLLLVWVCFLLRGLFYAAVVPMWEGYDEYAHFAYIQHLLVNGDLPTADTPISREVDESLKLVPVPWLLRDSEASHFPHDEYWKLPEDERKRRRDSLNSLPVEWAHQPSDGSLRI